MMRTPKASLARVTHSSATGPIGKFRKKFAYSEWQLRVQPHLGLGRSCFVLFPRSKAALLGLCRPQHRMRHHGQSRLRPVRAHLSWSGPTRM
ncbi:hypothetical protein LMH87_000583 [Akanthomyces muscarius]|uniref:Uncharacterized protein n=1 Tax=Akanthomyces muscarius TaxID=2231603 RepID=A0A9W8UNS6_AKAMU|nr:hypothetical protein LMH87_000583 [Akanthomyces muscarius]KAJ4155329.1 hypothetical protein LMH87_000583 [Akanthomyces muscarius]